MSDRSARGCCAPSASSRRSSGPGRWTGSSASRRWRRSRWWLPRAPELRRRRPGRGLLQRRGRLLVNRPREPGHHRPDLRPRVRPSPGLGRPRRWPTGSRRACAKPPRPGASPARGRDQSAGTVRSTRPLGRLLRLCRRRRGALLRAAFDRVLIAGDPDYEVQDTIGASWMVDQLWSNENLEIVDDGGASAGWSDCGRSPITRRAAKPAGLLGEPRRGLQLRPLPQVPDDDGGPGGARRWSGRDLPRPARSRCGGDGGGSPGGPADPLGRRARRGPGGRARGPGAAVDAR